MTSTVSIRDAGVADLEAICSIYNQGIEDRVATLDTEPKSSDEIAEWWSMHAAPYLVLVAHDENGVCGWASLNRFSHRCAHGAIADLSIYVARAKRGTGIGSRLLRALIDRAPERGFHKIVLHALNGNDAGKRLYRACGFADVGVFREHGMLDGSYVDVIAMERLLP